MNHMLTHLRLAFFGTLCALLSIGSSAYAFEPLCFGEFSEKIEKPLMRPPTLKPGSVNSNEGKRPNDEGEYAGARGVVRRPITSVYRWLLDHTNWKDMTKTKLKTVEGKKPGYMAFHTVDVDVNVWAFIRIQWVEEWAYALVEGTPQDPKVIQISYQKRSGTGHLKRLCGSITLKALGPDKTDLYLYEEALADRYHWEQMLEMHQNNLKRLDMPEKK
jgi:hypothetical protein